MSEYNQFAITFPPDVPYPVIVGTRETFTTDTPLRSKTFEGIRETLRALLKKQASLGSTLSPRAKAVLDQFDTLYAFPPTPLEALNAGEAALGELLANYRTREPSKVYLSDALVITLDDASDRGTLRFDLLRRGGVMLGFCSQAEEKVQSLLRAAGFQGPLTSWDGAGSASFKVRVPSQQLPRLRRAAAWLSSRFI